jgi:hypothetical protein
MSEAQNGFRRNRSCIDAVFSLKLLIEKRREYNLETQILFLDYEKASDSVLRPTLFDILRIKNISHRLLKAIIDIYDNKLSGSLVTTARHVFRLRIEETASRYGG